MIQLLVGSDSHLLTRLLLQRGLALVYLIAFLVALQQFIPLLGEQGLTPVPLFLQRASFLESPSLFFLHYSDVFARCVFALGAILSVFALSGYSERFGLPVSMATWFLLWVLYLSIVNVGQTWYSFGWESMLLEAGFLAIFLGSRDVAPPTLVIWLYRWMLFRLVLGAGLIKLRGDSCWRDLTCLHYHYETQPLPNPLSWFLHQAPAWSKSQSVMMTHVIQLVSPWAYFVPLPIVSAAAGLLTLLHQVLIALSGNLSFLNLLTIVVAFSTFSDRILIRILPLHLQPVAASPPLAIVSYGVGILVLFLSIAPALNLFSSRQAMNRSFEPLRLVNSYGAFGSVTKERYEIILEGTEDAVITPETTWIPYAFKAKPGDVSRMPPQIAPWHLRLDWLMWFAALGPPRASPWLTSLMEHLLRGDDATLSLLAGDPFHGRTPRFVRAQLYRYTFTSPSEKAQSGAWWSRYLVAAYIPPLSLQDLDEANLGEALRLAQ